MVQIWSRNTPNFGPNETFVLHRVEPQADAGRNRTPAGLRLIQNGGSLPCVEGVGYGVFRVQGVAPRANADGYIPQKHAHVSSAGSAGWLGVARGHAVWPSSGAQ